MMTKKEVLNHKTTNMPVWFIMPWTKDIVRAKIQEIKTDNCGEYAELSDMHLETNSLIDIRFQNTKRFDDLFPTREAVDQYFADKDAARKAKIRKQIRTKNDMIEFIFGLDSSDLFGRNVAKEIAREKWGIVLDY